MKKITRQIILFFVFNTLSVSAISANEKLIREELYFDGHSYALRYSVNIGMETGMNRITWYVRSTPPAEDHSETVLQPVAEGREWFIIPGSAEWLTCVAAGTDGLQKTETRRIARDLPRSPDPGLRKIYLTFPGPGETIILRGNLDMVVHPDRNGAAFINESGGHLFYRLESPGYYGFTMKTPAGPLFYNVFVSPVDSVHTERIDRDWYYTQFRTTTTSNCGPTVVSMGIAWARGRDVPVAKVRQILGWEGDGAVDFRQMKQVLAEYDVESEIMYLEGPETIFHAIDNDQLVGILYDMSGISHQPKPYTNLFDQYYTDKGGHYLAVKGYSKDKRYFIIYDPIPSDWRYNAARYADGESMYGRNRYYRVDELMKALKGREILIMKRPRTEPFTRMINSEEKTFY